MDVQVDTAPALRRSAALLMWVIAAGFGLPAVPVAVHLLVNDRLPSFLGLFPMYGGPVDAWVGTTGYALLIVLFGLLAAVEATVALLLWRGRRTGFVLSLAVLPVEIAFWLAFALPVPPLVAAVRLVLTLLAWRRRPG